MKQNITNKTKIAVLKKKLEEATGKKVVLKENIDTTYSMYENGIFQNWVDELFDSLIQSYGEDQLTPEIVKQVAKEVASSFLEVVDDNIQTYFYPDTL